MKPNANYVDSNQRSTVPQTVWITLGFTLVYFFLQSVAFAGNTTNFIIVTNEYPILQQNSYSVSDYFSDRGNDLLDIASLDYGYGAGISARLSTWGTGLSLAKIKNGIYSGNFNAVEDSEIYSFIVFGYSASRISDKNSHLADRNKNSGYENIMYPPLIADPLIIIMAAAINLGGPGSNFDDPMHLLLGWPMLYVEGIKQQPDVEVSAGFIPFGRFSFNFAELGDFMLGWSGIDFCRDDYHKTRTVIEKYPDGQIKQVATYRCKHPIGQWISWYKNRQKKEEGWYTNCGKTGVWNSWNVNGIKSGQEKYSCGRKQGSSTWWFANGIISETGFFSNNLKQGVWTTWHKDGTKAGKRTYLNDRLNGICLTWHNNGSKAAERMYVNGNRDGVWSEWHSNGVIASKKIYKLNNFVGTNTCWFNTEIESNRDCYYTTNGTNYNRKISWHKNGNKKEENLYVDGILTIRKRWSENGILTTDKVWSKDGKILKNKKFN